MTLPDTDDLSTLGGAKQNYAPVEDPTVDIDADHHNIATANVAMMTHLATRAACSFETHGTTPVDPSGFVHDACWGSLVGVKPTVTRAALGTFDVQWPASVTDELGETHTVALRRAWASAEGATALILTVTRTDVRTVRVRVFDDAGAATDAAGTVITVAAI